ncbi:MAG: hypothetical protein JW845_01195 [Dehalococcoidales bacterium]|nr:hypothetical protein [Dehalococcoidales bacterium]
MAEKRYAKNIVTDTREYTPEEIAKMQEMMKDNPIESTVELERLLWMDDTKVKGATFYMECIWLWGGKTTSGTTEEPHVHPFDEVIGFISSDPDNPKELDARMEIILGDETHFLTKSCLVHVPAGMKHCPLTFREVNRPVFFFTLAPISRYGRESESMKSKDAPPLKIPPFKPPPKDKSGSRYSRYIITEPKRHGPPPPPPKAKATHMVSLDGEVSPGAFYVDFVWIWSGDMTMAPEPHAHDFDEMIGLVGWSDKEHPRAINGDVSITIGDELHNIKQSSLVFVPRGLKHCPIEFKNIKRPVLCFTIGNTAQWTHK